MNDALVHNDHQHHVEGKIASDWEWRLLRLDRGTTWVGQISKGEQLCLLTYEHAETIAKASVRFESPQDPEVTPESLCAGIWPVVEDYLLSLM